MAKENTGKSTANSAKASKAKADEAKISDSESVKDTDLNTDEAEDDENSDENSGDSDSDSSEDEAEDDERLEDESNSSEEAKKPSNSSGSKRSTRLKPAPEKDAVEEEVDTDYLRQYQYKKVNDVPTIGGVMTDPDKGSKAEKMKTLLLAQPKVRIIVARDPGEHGSVLMSVNLNSYRLDFPKNTYIEMPEQIAEVIMQSQAQTDAALKVFRIDGDTKKESALL